MQIHELPAGTPAAGMTFAGDTGSQTQKIDYNALADAILNKLTTKTFDIKSEAQTIIAALNALGDASEQGVANNLVTTGAGYVLDARQGKALSDLHATNADAIAALNSSVETLKNSSSSGAVDIKSYNTSSNVYVFPADGYVYVDSGGGATAGTYIRFAIRTANGTSIGGVYMNVTGSYQTRSVFVKKGMYGFLAQVNATNNYTVNFVPLNYR